MLKLIFLRFFLSSSYITNRYHNMFFFLWVGGLFLPTFMFLFEYIYVSFNNFFSIYLFVEFWTSLNQTTKKCSEKFCFLKIVLCPKVFLVRRKVFSFKNQVLIIVFFCFFVLCFSSTEHKTTVNFLFNFCLFNHNI